MKINNIKYRNSVIVKYLFVICFASIIVSCKKTEENRCGEINYVAPSSEVAQLFEYLPNDAALQKHPSGFYYKISSPGSDIKPNTCSLITVNYIGYFLSDNTIFDNKNGIVFSLGGQVLGWQKGLPLIGVGGAITLYLPPSLAYGASGTNVIPPNAYLKFDIQLTNVQ